MGKEDGKRVFRRHVIVIRARVSEVENSLIAHLPFIFGSTPLAFISNLGTTRCQSKQGLSICTPCALLFVLPYFRHPVSVHEHQPIKKSLNT